MACISKAQWIVPGASMNLTVNIKLFLKLIYITYSFRSSFSAKNTHDIGTLPSWCPWQHVWAMRQPADLTLYNEDHWESTTGSHLNCTGHTGSSSVHRTWRCCTSGITTFSIQMNMSILNPIQHARKIKHQRKWDKLFYTGLYSTRSLGNLKPNT